MNKIKTRDKNFIRKGERGSVTLFVLIAMMFFLTVGVGVYMANVNTQQAQQKGVKKVQLEYSGTDNIDNIYKDQVEKLGQKLIIVVKDSEKNIYQEGTWTNKLPLTIIANWPDGTKKSEKKVSLTSPSKVTTTYNFDTENTALILDNKDNNIENGKWTAQVEVGGKKQSVEIWIDTIAPTCTITAEPDKNPTNADSITFTLKNEDLSGLVSDIDYSKLENIITVTDKNNNKLENGSDVTWDWIENENKNNKVKFTINKDDFEGNIKITIPAGTLTDNAGNKSEEVTKEVKIDKKAPTCTITANPDKNPTNASSIVYTFKWSEEVTGFTTEDITVTNGTKGIFTAKSATEYTLAVTTQANQNNTQTINVAAGKCKDIAENGNIAVNKEVKIDRVTPTCTITANPDKNPTNASSITYTFTWSEEVTGFTTEDITVTKGTKGTFTKTSGTVYTLVVTTQANQDNTQTINVAAGKCTDIAGNENAAISKEVKIDRKSPTCTITANPNKSPTNASSITYTFTWSEEVTGFTTEDITVTNGTKGTFTKTSGTVYTLVVTTAAKQDNTQKVVINTNVCTDVVGNGNIATSKEVKIDRKAPPATSCEVKNITATGYDVYVYGVTDSTGVDRVLFPTWTQNNGQDDIQANWWETTNDTAKGENLGNGTWHYRVNVTDHKNEYGTYTTHVYTYDTLGNKQICSSTNIEVPAVNITYLSDNLVYGLENRSSTTDHNMTYSISNGVVTVTANASDGWGNTTGRVYLEANTQYEFTCTTSATSGTWGNSVEAFLLLNGSTSTYIRMDSNNNYRFTPAQSGTYYIRLDVNTSGKTYTFSNIDVRKIVLTETKNYGLTLATLPAYSRTGYTFNGWFTAKTGGTKIATTTPVPGVNTTYYAQTKANTYTVKYDGNGATSGSTASSSHTYNVAKALTANGFARTGYTFNGWNTKADGTGTSYANSASVINLTSTNGATVTLYAKWTANNYKILFDSNGGTGTMASISTQYGKDTTLTANAFSKKYTVKYSTNGGNAVSNSVANQLFMGWTLGGKNMYEFTNLRNVSNTTINSDGTLTINKSNTTSSTIWSNLFFKSNSEIEANTNYVAILDVKSKTNTGSSSYYPSSDNGTDTAQIASASTVSINNIGIGRNYINIKSKSTTTGHSNLTRSFWTIYANASLNIKFRPILVKGTYSNIPLYYYNSGVARDLTSTNNGSVTLYADWGQPTITLPTPTRTGYTFAGWYSDSGLTSKIGNGGSTYRPAKDITLYAKWTANTYTVKYDGNGATSGSTASSSHTYNVAKALTANEFVKIGYTFNGWNTKADGTGTSYANSASVTNLASTNGATVTLYAKWTATTYPISYVGAATSVSSYTINTATFTLTNPTKTGYTFKGWTEKILLKRWYSGFTNYNTGAVEKNTTYPNSVFSEFIYLKANTTYTLTGTNLGNIRWRIYNLDGTYNSNASTSTTCKPTANCYASILLYDGCTEANRTAAYITTSGNITSVSIPKGSTGNRSYTSNFADETAPTVTFGTNGNTTYAKSQSTTVTVTDSGSGVNTSSLKYQWTQSTTAPAESTFSTTFTSGKAITKNTGTGSNWYLWILAKDNAGNKTIKRSNAFYLDNTAPTASVSPTAPVAKNKVTITLKDAHSKVKYWAVTTSTTAPTTTSTTITTNTSTLNTWYPVTAATQVSTTFTPGTTSKYYVWVKDSVGNGATAYAATFTPTAANYEISKSGTTTYYETILANATANAVTGSTIKVLNSVTESTAATIEEGKSLTINTNQKTITMNNCNIKNNGSLIVKGQGTIKCSTGKSEGSVIVSTGDLNIGLVTIVNTVGEGIYAGGTMNMSAGTVTGKTAGIEVTGTTTITGGTVSATGSNEGAIEPGGLGGKATININGGTITGDYGVCQGGQRVETAQVIVNIGATSGDINGGPVVKGNKNAIGMNNGGTVNFYQGKLQGGTERVSTIPFSAIRSGYMVYLDNTSSTTVHTISLKPTSFGTAVAMINNINYYTIQAAIECCGNAETTIEQISDITSGTVIAKTAKDHNIIWTKKVGNYTSEISATGTMVENNGKLTMKLIYIEIEGGTASPIITNNGDLTLWGGEYHNYVNSASIVNNLGSGNITTKEAVDIDGSGYGIYSTSIGTVSVTSLSTISGGTYGIYSSGLGHVVVNQGTVYGTTFGIYARGDCDVTFGTLGSTYNKISGIQAMGKSGVSVNITGGEGEITNSSGIAIETSAASVNIDDEQATIQGTTQGIKTISGNITVKKGIVKATGTAAPGIVTTTGSITLGVNDGTVSTTTPAITGNGNAAIVKNDPKTGTMAMYDGRLKGTAPVVSASAAGASNYEYNGGTIIKPEGYSLNITLGFAILKK